MIIILNMFDVLLAEVNGTNEEKAELTCPAKYFAQLLHHVYDRLLARDSATTNFFYVNNA
mgnify:CR=1 FL=1